MSIFSRAAHRSVPCGAAWGEGLFQASFTCRVCWVVVRAGAVRAGGRASERAERQLVI